MHEGRLGQALPRAGAVRVELRSELLEHHLGLLPAEDARRILHTSASRGVRLCHAVGVPLIRLETVIHASIEACFEMSLSVDFHLDSMGPSGERAVAGVTSGQMGPGDQVTWAARHLGIPIRMTSVISAYEKPTFFIDEQVRGPFERWRHEHHFETIAGGTRMLDVADFAAPIGVIGRLAERVLLTAYLTKLLTQRNTHLKTALEA